MQLFRFAFQRTTLDFLAALQVSISAVHHSSTIKVHENYLPSAEDLTSDSLHPRFPHYRCDLGL